MTSTPNGCRATCNQHICSRVNRNGINSIVERSTEYSNYCTITTNACIEFTTVNVSTYNSIGPKNEVYIAPGQAVAFNLNVSTNRKITSLDIGAKTIVTACVGEYVSLKAVAEDVEILSLEDLILGE